MAGYRPPREFCTKCGEVRDGADPYRCKACFAAYMRERRAANPEKSRAQARKSYQRRMENGGIPKGEFCSKCGKVRDGSHASYCIECFTAYQIQWNMENAEKRAVIRRRSHLKSLYGISTEEFEAMLSEQAGLCLICNSVMSLTEKTGGRMVHVDHNHDTGDVRGLLCSRCNQGLGCFDDSPDLMVAAAAYILRDQMIHDEEK